MKLKSFLKRLESYDVRIWEDSDDITKPIFEGACFDVPKRLKNRKI